MATNIQFTTRTFYNRKGQAIQLRISNEDFLGNTTFLHVQSLRLKYDLDGQIITSSLDIEFVNDTTNYHLFDTLLFGTERQFKCELFIDGASYWEGFLINDLSEQDLLDYAVIKLTFTDYLKRLQETTTSDLILGKVSLLIDLLRTCLYETGLEYDIRVNTNFYPEYALNELSSIYWVYTMYEQVLVQDDVFFEDELTTKSPYEVLQAILKINNSFLYTYQKKWYIEQYSEITDREDDSEGGHWHEFVKGEDSSAYGGSVYGGAEDHPPDSISSQYNSINRQNDDFKYVKTSQKLQYESGLKELEINIQRQTFDTLVYNNFSLTPPTDDPRMNSTNYKVGTWYVSENLTYSFDTGYNFRGIFKWFRWTMVSAPTSWNGIGYHFRFSYNSEGDFNNPTMLTIRYKWTFPQFRDLAVNEQAQVKTRFLLKEAGNTGRILGEDANGDPEWVEQPHVDQDYFDNTKVQYFDLTDKVSAAGIVEVSEQIDITSLFDSGTSLDNEWTLIIWPTLYRVAAAEDDIEDSTEYFPIYHIVGDVNVSVSAGDEENVSTYTVTDDFIKRKKIDLLLFDTPNLNYRNGLFYAKTGVGNRRYRSILTFPRTELWGKGDITDSYGIIDPKMSIVDWTASFLYSYYSEIRIILTARIDIDELLKPLTIITDDNIYKDSESNILDLILFEYEYDLYTNIMRIVANEYGNEDVNIIES